MQEHPLTQQKTESILILLINWNGKKDTIECLQSLAKLSYANHFILVVDNGSTDDSCTEIQKQFPHIAILQTHANLGFAGGNNIGISYGLKHNFDWILLLNNDTIVNPDFLEKFIECSQKKPEGKIFGAKIYNYSEPKKIDHLGGVWNPNRCDFDSLHQNQIDDDRSFESMQEVDYVCGACMMIHNQVFRKIGLLEPKFFLFWEETDFCFRAKKAGFSTWTAPSSKIWHKINASFSGGKPHSYYFWWRSRLLWVSRNLPKKEILQMYKNHIIPDLWKISKHFVLRFLQNRLSYLLLKKPTPTQLLKESRNKAGLLGASHYFFGRFGNCPSNLIKKS